MIELRRIGLSYADRAAGPVLDGVDLTVAEGELVLVTGPTGSGKSTLLGVLTGLVPRFSGGTLSGDVLLDGVSIVRTPPRERAHLVGYVGQDPAAGFVTDTVEEELAYGMEQLGLPGDTMRRRVEETLDLLGISALRHRDLRQLSGGEQQRVALGSVLDHASARAGARRADQCPRPDGCRGRAGHPDATGPRSRRAPWCWPSTGWNGWCRSPTRWSRWPGTGRCERAPRSTCSRTQQSLRRWSSSAGRPAGSRCR